MRLARRKLDSWGTIKSHCGFVSSAENLKRYENMTTMAASIAEIEGMQDTGRENKQREFEDEMKENAAAGLQRLADKKLALVGLTMKHICCLLFTKYDQFLIETKHNKNKLVSMLKENIDQNRAALGLDAGVDLSGLDPIYTSYLTNK